MTLLISAYPSTLLDNLNNLSPIVVCIDTLDVLYCSMIVLYSFIIAPIVNSNHLAMVFRHDSLSLFQAFLIKRTRSSDEKKYA